MSVDLSITTPPRVQSTVVTQNIEAALALIPRTEQELTAISILKRPSSTRTADENSFVEDWINYAHPRLFHEFSSEVIKELVGKLNYEAFTKKEIIFHQGETADRMYALIRGSVSMWQLPLPKKALTAAELSELRQKGEIQAALSVLHTPMEHVPSQAHSRPASSQAKREALEVLHGTDIRNQANNSPNAAPTPFHLQLRAPSASPSRANSRPTSAQPGAQGSSEKLQVEPTQSLSKSPSTSSLPDTSAEVGSPSNPLYMKRTARSEARDFLEQPPPLPQHLASLARSMGIENWKARFQLLGTLRVGGAKVVFGEHGLLQGASRSATIRAEDLPTECLTVSKNDFELILKHSYHADINNKFEALCKIHLFQALLHEPEVERLPTPPRPSARIYASKGMSQTASTASLKSVAAASSASAASHTPAGATSPKLLPKRKRLTKTGSDAMLSPSASSQSISNSSSTHASPSASTRSLAASSSDNADATKSPDGSSPGASVDAFGAAQQLSQPVWDLAVSIQALKKLALYFEQRTIQPRTMIVTQGSPASYVYCLVEGQVEIIHTLARAVDDGEAVVNDAAAEAEKAEKERRVNLGLEGASARRAAALTSHAGKHAGGYGTVSKRVRRIFDKRRTMNPTSLAPTPEVMLSSSVAPAPPCATPTPSVLLARLSAGECFGELDHQYGPGAFGLQSAQTPDWKSEATVTSSTTGSKKKNAHPHGLHPFGLRSVGVVRMLTLTREDWIKKVLGGASLPGGIGPASLLDRSTMRKLRARDVYRGERALSLDQTQTLASTLKPASSWKSPRSIQLGIAQAMQQANLAAVSARNSQLAAAATRKHGPPAPTNTSVANQSTTIRIVNQHGQSGWRSIRDLGEIVSQDTLVASNTNPAATAPVIPPLNMPASLHASSSFSSFSQTERLYNRTDSKPNMGFLSSRGTGEYDAKEDVEEEKINSKRLTFPPLLASLSVSSSTTRLISPSASTARLIQAQRISHASLPPVIANSPKNSNNSLTASPSSGAVGLGSRQKSEAQLQPVTAPPDMNPIISAAAATAVANSASKQLSPGASTGNADKSLTGDASKSNFSSTTSLRKSYANAASGGAPSPRAASGAIPSSFFQSNQSLPEILPAVVSSISIDTYTPATLAPLAPLPSSLAWGREVAARKSLRDLEADRDRVRAREAARLAPQKPQLHPKTSSYNPDVYKVKVNSEVGHAKRFRATDLQSTIPGTPEKLALLQQQQMANKNAMGQQRAAAAASATAAATASNKQQAFNIRDRNVRFAGYNALRLQPEVETASLPESYEWEESPVENM